MADYVAGTGPLDGATAAEGRSCWLRSAPTSAQPTSTSAPGRTIVRVALPADRVDYRWLEISSSRSSLAVGTYRMTDGLAYDECHRIEFNAIADGGDRQYLQLTSCPQWLGYGPTVYLDVPADAAVVTSLRT